MPEKSTYSIRELEELSGIPAHTIRTWERRYHLLTPVRDAGNTRCYARDVVGYLRHLAVLLKHGHRISALACKPREEIQALALEVAPPTSGEITGQLCHAMQDYNVSKLNSLVSCYIRKEGFDQSLLFRYIPFLEKMSFLLLSGTLELTHAQMFYSVMKQKIYAAIEALPLSKQSPTWLLLHGAPDADALHRDILQYLLRKADKQAIGVNAVVKKDLTGIVETASPETCLVIADEGMSDEELQRILTQLEPLNQEIVLFTPAKTLHFPNNLLTTEVEMWYGLRIAFFELSRSGENTPR